MSEGKVAPRRPDAGELGFVRYIGDGAIRVVACTTEERRHLKSCGARRALLAPREFILRYDSDEALAAQMTRLRDRGFAFAGASWGWHPAQIFELFRERKLVRGSFIELANTFGGLRRWTNREEDA